MGLMGLMGLVELVTVPEVVPDAVEATGDAGDGSQEGVAHPDGKYGVLLTAGLGGADGVVVAAAHPSAKGELGDAGEQRYGCDGQLIAPGGLAVDDALGGDGNGQ